MLVFGEGADKMGFVQTKPKFKDVMMVLFQVESPRRLGLTAEVL